MSGLLRIAARRAYAAEAAAAQTGLGSLTSRGLTGAVRRADVQVVGQLAETSTADAGQEPAGEAEAPAWMRMLATVLAMQGWDWPVTAALRHGGDLLRADRPGGLLRDRGQGRVLSCTRGVRDVRVPGLTRGE